MLNWVTWQELSGGMEIPLHEAVGTCWLLVKVLEDGGFHVIVFQLIGHSRPNWNSFDHADSHPPSTSAGSWIQVLRS